MILAPLLICAAAVTAVTGLALAVSGAGGQPWGRSVLGVLLVGLAVWLTVGACAALMAGL